MPSKKQQKSNAKRTKSTARAPPPPPPKSYPAEPSDESSPILEQPFQPDGVRSVAELLSFLGNLEEFDVFGDGSCAPWSIILHFVDGSIDPRAVAQSVFASSGMVSPLDQLDMQLKQGTIKSVASSDLDTSGLPPAAVWAIRVMRAYRATTAAFIHTHKLVFRSESRVWSGNPPQRGTNPITGASTWLVHEIDWCPAEVNKVLHDRHWMTDRDLRGGAGVLGCDIYAISDYNGTFIIFRYPKAGVMQEQVTAQDLKDAMERGDRLVAILHVNFNHFKMLASPAMAKFLKGQTSIRPPAYALPEGAFARDLREATRQYHKRTTRFVNGELRLFVAPNEPAINSFGGMIPAGHGETGRMGMWGHVVAAPVTPTPTTPPPAPIALAGMVGLPGLPKANMHATPPAAATLPAGTTRTAGPDVEPPLGAARTLALCDGTTSTELPPPGTVERVLACSVDDPRILDCAPGVLPPGTKKTGKGADRRIGVVLGVCEGNAEACAKARKAHKLAKGEKRGKKRPAAAVPSAEAPSPAKALCDVEIEYDGEEKAEHVLSITVTFAKKRNPPHGGKMCVRVVV
eukprot:CAMPEP_0119504330 /NCGR_PEP_ID=MMETSP1344-20130328/25222_1 /TAXON_ID=236787 /ORGANISM="Florenciella parvula, Strain CCMP2471" /LENGTH=571 /DNA_ID=CAMNT_0007540689 /DNA_START=51 /DNA_END=1766 /DNA_ORIENTATION=+